MPSHESQAAAGLADQVIAWRRAMHAHPELSGQEEWTAGYVADRLREFGYHDVTTRVGGGWGVTTELRVSGATRTIALRADMDALPITEETGVEYASRVAGVMHACGHDCHTAMLLGAAKLLRSRADIVPVNVRFIFQPHEEVYPGGAQGMIAAGVLDGVSAIFGLHMLLGPGRFIAETAVDTATWLGMVKADPIVVEADFETSETPEAAPAPTTAPDRFHEARL